MSWFGQWFDRVRGRTDRAWAGSVSELLYDGESIRQRVTLEDGNRVVVTSHRLLAFTPGSDGQNYRGVDLPNVADVRAGYEGERNLLWQGGRTLLYGAILLAVGLFLDFESFVPTDAFQQTGAAGQLGMGGLLSLLQQFLALIARIDEFARMIGALLVIFAMFIFGVYVLTRDRVLVIEVAGDGENAHVPASEGSLEGAVADLEAALFGTGATVGSGAVAEAGVSEPPDDDPLAADSGAVRSDGIADPSPARPSEPDSEPASEPASEPDSEADSEADSVPDSGSTAAADASGEEIDSAVDRAVRETRQSDVSESVDDVLGGSDRTVTDAPTDSATETDTAESSDGD